MRLRRSVTPLTLFVMMFLVVGGTPYGVEEIVPRAGPGMAIAVLVAMALFWAAPYALIVSELVAALPEEGALYPWFKASFGRFWSFVFAYVDWVTWVLDACLYPPLVAAYLLAWLTPEPSRQATWGVSLLIIWTFTLLNIRGIDVVGRLSGIASLVVALPLVALVLLGWPKLSLASLQPLVPDGTPVGAAFTYAVIWCMWTYSGYEALANAAEEIVEPERHYPRLLAVFLPLSILAHVLPLLVGLAATPDWRAWQTGHFDRVAFAIGGTSLAALVALSGQCAGLGLFSGGLLVNSRRPWAMARDGELPALLARLHPTFHTPHVCLLLLGVLYSVLTYFLSFTQILVVSTWVSLPVYFLTFAAPVVLRLKHPGIRGRFRIPGGWPGLLLAVLSPSLIAGYVMLNVEREEMLVGLGLMALGPLLYWARPAGRARS